MRDDTLPIKYFLKGTTHALDDLELIVSHVSCLKKKKQDVYVKHTGPDNGQLQRWSRSQGQIS